MKPPACRLPRFAGLAAALAVLAVLTALPGANAQESSALAQGSHLFRHILHKQDLKPATDLDLLKSDPEHTILIVLGQTEVLNEIDLPAFIRRGGAALIATDRDTYDRQRKVSRLKEFGVYINGSTLHVGTDSGYAYKGHDDCIFIETDRDKHPIFEALTVHGKRTEVATNRPSALSRNVPRLPVLASFPQGCTEEGVRRTSSSPLIFAVGGDMDAGRILILSDHSVFINGMLYQNDLENWDFATNCILWLKDGKRTQVLFVEEDLLRSSFDVPLQDPPLPPPEAVVRAFDNGLSALEAENWFNRMAMRGVSGIDPHWFVRVLLLLLSLALGIYGLNRLGQARHRSEPRLPALAMGQGLWAPHLGMLEQRHRAMLQEGSFWEAARALARQSWETALGSQVAAVGATPPVRVRGGWWRHRQLRRQVQELWRLAYGSQPERVSARRLAQLSADMNAVRTALANGTLQRTTD
jgi:hypothetical protein